MRNIGSIVIALGLCATIGSLVGQQPAPRPATPGAAQPVAYVYGTTAISTEEFGKFLMDRGGAEKLELFVNKRIIEMEAAKRNITVTKIEIEAALAEDLEGLPGTVTKADFIKVLLPSKYGKTYYEWMEDVIRPRLLLTKMCRDRVKVKEEDLKIEFERRHGEKRRCQMLMWPLGDEKQIVARFDNARKSQEEFDREAKQMVNPNLALSLGHMKPISRHLIAEDKQVEHAAFSLKVGEISHVMKTPQGYIVIKLHEIIPPNAAVKFEDERKSLEKAAFDELLTKEIPTYFAELKKAANPELKYTPPSDWRTGGSFLDSVPDIIKSVGATQPTPAGLPPVGK